MDDMNEKYELKENKDEISDSDNISSFDDSDSDSDDREQELRAKVRRIAIPLFIIIFIFLMYKVLGWYSASKQPAQPKIVKTELVATVKPAVVESVVPLNNEMTQKITSLMDQVQKNSDELTKIETALSENDAKFSELNSSMINLSGAINALVSKIESINTPKPKAKPKKVRKFRKVAPRALYHVKAIVPGRAWLEDSDGMTITVRTGDRLNGGIIELISPQQGIIATSSGEIIQYGSNDI